MIMDVHVNNPQVRRSEEMEFGAETVNSLASKGWGSWEIELMRCSIASFSAATSAMIGAYSINLSLRP
jgi:hypothetical protein